jgi:excinuclease ABC subunit C
MASAAKSEQFEEAARLRDRIGAVERTVERQQIVGARRADRDVFGLARRGGDVEVHVLHVREGRVIGAQGYPLDAVPLDDGEVMSSFLAQYYALSAGRPIPGEIVSPAPIDDGGALESWLSDRAEARVALRVPQRGALRELVAMAHENAELGLAQRLEAQESVASALAELGEALGLPGPPRRIEGYDISTLHGTLTVGSRVVFENGQPHKNDYRRYRIREAPPDDDYACLREVIGRRLARAEREPLPDLLLIDGGKGQLAVVSAALADARITAHAASIAKEKDEQSASPRVKRSGGLKAERVFLPNRKDPIVLPPSSRALLLLQRVRDESHRFAIEFQRKLRSKQNFASILEELPGIGPGKRRALLTALGSLRAVREASVEALEKVPGISPRNARTIAGFFASVGAEKP